MRYCVLLGTFLMVSFANAEDKPAVRKIDLKDVKLKHEGKEPQNSEIASAEALLKSKLFADEASRELVKKQVDFAKEKLVVSAWSASEGGRFTTEIERGETELLGDRISPEKCETLAVSPPGFLEDPEFIG